MTGYYYRQGAYAALTKLGMQVAFTSAQQARDHASTREMVGDVTGFAGSMVGGAVGSAVGTAAGTAVAGPVGSVAGSVGGGIAGSMAGEKALALPATTAYDAQRDIQNRHLLTKNKALGQMNAAAGLPTGRRL